jgi:DNA-binding response OmpR family regulator
MAQAPKILVVDDEETIQFAIETALEDRGWEITTVGTGAEAIAAAAKAPFDVLILDKNLPDITGVEVLKTIRTHDRSARAIMLTGYASVESAVEMSVLGIDAYLEKPLKHIYHIATVVESSLTLKQQADVRTARRAGTSTSLTANDQALNFLLKSAVVGPRSDERKATALALKELDLNPVVADSPEDIGIANLVFVCHSDPLAMTQATRKRFPDDEIVVVCEAPEMPLARALIDVGISGIIKGSIDTPGSRHLLRQVVTGAVKRLG